MSRCTQRRAVGALFAAVLAVASTWIGGGAVGVPAAHAANNPGGEYHPLAPQRIYDSRPGAAINEAQPGPKPASPAGSSFDIQLLGVGGVPAASTPSSVLAVVVSITVAAPTRAGYLSAFPSGVAAGESSIVNFGAGQTAPNLAVVRPGDDGRLRIQLTTPDGDGSAHVLVDVFGWFSTSEHTEFGARLITTDPARVLDTRTINDPLGAGEWVTLGIRGAQVGGTTVVPADPNVTGVVVNLTGANDLAGSTQTFVSAVPQETAGWPTTSNLNLAPNQVRANLAVVPLGPNGEIHLFNEAGSTHLIVDVVGYLIDGQNPATNTGRVVPLVSPFRVLDTRLPSFGSAQLGPGQAEDWGMAQFVSSVRLNGQPVGAIAGTLGNITAVDLRRQYPTVPISFGYLTLYPTPAGAAATTPPTASNVNFPEGSNVANLALVRFSADDQFRVYNGLGYTHYIFDVAAVILE